MKRNGFSLVELSIVILIIGILVGSIIAGQALIKSAQLKAVIAELHSHVASVNTFRDHYGYLPGDYPNAGQVWTAGSANCPNGPTPGGCNGSGDGKIRDDNSSGHESWRAWQHMALANIEAGNFNGSNTSMPKSKYPNAKYGILSVGSTGGTKYFNTQGLAIIFGSNNGSGYPHNAALIPVDAKSIDMKIDDGVANSGMLYAIDGFSGTSSGDCSKPYTSSNGSDYNLSNKHARCMLVYWIFKE
jgi:prepilin-type N-terminal cleavage/methylation domain-containing protein